jgi:hypothetical protein
MRTDSIVYRLLGSMDLGDKQPSQLLREIQRLALDVRSKIAWFLA